MLLCEVVTEVVELNEEVIVVEEVAEEVMVDVEL